MPHSTIRKIIKIEDKGVWITTIEDAEGNELTGVGKDYTVDTPIITYFDDKYGRAKFSVDSTHPFDSLEARAPHTEAG